MFLKTCLKGRCLPRPLSLLVSRLWHRRLNRSRCAGGTRAAGGRRRPSSRFTTGIAEEPEEIGIRPQQETGIIALQPGLVGAHGAVEGEEILILAICFREQPVTLTVAFAAHPLRGRIGFRDNDGRFTIRIGADLLRLLAALGAEFGRLALPLGLHALIDRLAVLLRQIGPPDP